MNLSEIVLAAIVCGVGAALLIGVPSYFIAGWIADRVPRLWQKVVRRVRGGQ